MGVGSKKQNFSKKNQIWINQLECNRGYKIKNIYESICNWEPRMTEWGLANI